MPGICGIIDLTSETATLDLDAMVTPLQPHPWFVEERWVEASGLALAAVSLECASRQSHLAVDIQSGMVCALDGEVYNAQDLRRSLGLAEADVETDAKLLLSGWKLRGHEFLRSLNGSFSAVVWNPAVREVMVVTDRFGNRPLYYATDDGKLIFGSSIRSVLAVSRQARTINVKGLAQFFTFGHYLRDDTSLQSVRVVPAAAACRWDVDRGEWREERYYAWSEAYSAYGPMSEDQWIDRIGAAFASSVRQQARHTLGLGLSLSGGLDARSILALIDIKETPLTSICLGVQGSLDHRCAQQLATMAGCRNHSHILDTSFLASFETHLQRMVELTDGQYLSQCIVMPTLPLYRQLGIEVLLRGHGGELMHMYKAYNYSLDEEALGLSSVQQLQAWLQQRLQAYMLQGIERPLFAKGLQDAFLPLATESLRADVVEAEAPGPVAQRIWQLFITQRLRRETVLSLNKFRSVAETRLPFFDNELMSLLLAAPPELKLGEKLQAGILKRYRPEFLGVVNANTGTKVGAGPLRRKCSSLMLRAAAKLGFPGYQPYERLGLWLRRELAGTVRGILLDPVTLDRGLYDSDGIRGVVENHLAGRRNHTFLLMSLMIFELGQRYLTREISSGYILQRVSQ